MTVAFVQRDPTEIDQPRLAARDPAARARYLHAALSQIPRLLGAIDRGLEALLVEAKRVDQFGFLQSELDREKQSLIRGYERAYAEREKTQ